MKTRSGEMPAQNQAELAWLIAILRRERVARYLEVGALNGDTLWQVGVALPVGARLVAVDSPGGKHGRPCSLPHLRGCIADLRAAGYDAHLILGDSQAAGVVAAAAALGPYDAVLIDGDHSFAGCWHDWQAYGPMSRLVAFHDIAWLRGDDWVDPPIEVPAVWGRLKTAYRHEEIRMMKCDCGIGVLYR